MADTQQLPTSTSNGTQTSTDSPQTAVQPTGFAGAQTSTVQPGTSSLLLNNSTGGIPLGNSSVSTVSLSPTSTATQTATATPVHHAINPVLLGFSGLLFVIAIAMFWATSRSAKNTTN